MNVEIGFLFKEKKKELSRRQCRGRHYPNIIKKKKKIL
jgi:hypothetical protein